MTTRRKTKGRSGTGFAPAQYRQGDVFVERLADDAMAPPGLAPVAPDARGRLVLAEGEQTGHAHTIDAGLVRSPGLADSGDLHFSLSEDVALSHEEHAPIPLPVGRYRALRQREYAPEEIRNVAD